MHIALLYLTISIMIQTRNIVRINADTELFRAKQQLQKAATMLVTDDEGFFHVGPVGNDATSLQRKFVIDI